ncbi:hypothetical protein BLA29_006811 [Euroglyphus maynei]|uniref:Uncharacterized protein n=1 Tax=Euroglyphus maynei TaxID=6958 RepID=A0A1Y3B2K2_EURMA|nr:hypothetical protein BLA29_006811 [Euroglyphus maynei]
MYSHEYEWNNDVLNKFVANRKNFPGQQSFYLIIFEKDSIQSSNDSNHHLIDSIVYPDLFILTV